MVFGEWLGRKVDDSVVPAIDELILRLPEVGVQMEYMVAKAQEMADKVLLVPNAIGDAFEWLKKRALEFTATVNYGMTGEKATRWAERVMAADSPEKRRNERLAEMREAAQQARSWAENQRKQRAAAAEARDAARAADQEKVAAIKKAEDARRKADMEADERAREKAAKDAKLMEENQQRWENYKDRRRRYEEAVAEKAYDKLSIRGQERSLTRQARAEGVTGEVSPESIRRRLDELAKAGAKSNEQEIARLERILHAWDALTERKEKYARTRAEDKTELRISAMRAVGNTRGADKLQQQLDMARRVEELRNAGASQRAAQEQAARGRLP